MRKFIYLGMFACMTVSLFAQRYVAGTVYEDVNRNGRRDKGEKGIASVAVSNGTDVSLTDAAGKYRLPADSDFIVFAVKPAGYQMETDEFNLPKSYYRHKPSGSPDSFYKGVKPTGKLPASVDFALYKQDESETFTVLIFGDTQPYTEQELEYLERGIIAEARNVEGVSFGITLGDLVGDNLNLHTPYKHVIKQMGIPWYNVMGNHDMNYDAKEDRLSDESFEASFGPNTYAFNYGKAHFIILDDVLYPHPVTGKGYWGGLRDDQFAFVKNNLASVPNDRLIVISMHIPMTDYYGEEGVRNADRERLYDLLKDYPNVLFLSAHTHIQMQHRAGKEQGLDREQPIHEYNVGTTCGDWFSGILNENGIPVSTMRDGTPAGYAFLRIDGNRYLLDYKVLGKPDDYQLSLYHPKVVPFRRSTGASIYANFFMGSAGDTVECRIDGSAWLKMQHVEEFDPAYYHYVQDWDYLEQLVPGRRPSNPIVCSHLWKTGVQTGLPEGKHLIEVRAKDRFGRVHSASSTYTISKTQ
jgi:hypothetical protein